MIHADATIALSTTILNGGRTEPVLHTVIYDVDHYPFDSEPSDTLGELTMSWKGTLPREGGEDHLTLLVKRLVKRGIRGNLTEIVYQDGTLEHATRFGQLLQQWGFVVHMTQY